MFSSLLGINFFHKTIFLLLFLAIGQVIIAQEISVQIKSNEVIFMEGQDSILVYQIGEKSLEGKSARSNYIHPLYTLDGEILTEDFPEDHPHHRGIFWAWHQLYIGDERIGDGWETKDFSWTVKSVNQMEALKPSKSIRAEVLWTSLSWTNAEDHLLPIVKEITTMTVHPVTDSYRQIDFEISLRALEDEMRIGGSEDEKGYGGFSTRIRLAEDVKFSGIEGEVIPKNLPVESEGWINISGSMGKQDQQAGLVIISHAENPGYPNPWILRASNSMQNAVYPHPGAEAVPLIKTKSTTLRYRLLIHNGEITHQEIKNAHYDFNRDQ